MTAKTASYRVVILWEDEIRAAAKALSRFRDKNVEVTSDEAASVALMCIAALLGAENDDACLVLSRKPEVAP